MNGHKKANSMRRDVRCWMLDFGCWILDARFWILDAGYCTQFCMKNSLLLAPCLPAEAPRVGMAPCFSLLASSLFITFYFSEPSQFILFRHQKDERCYQQDVR